MDKLELSWPEPMSFGEKTDRGLHYMAHPTDDPGPHELAVRKIFIDACRASEAAFARTFSCKDMEAHYRLEEAKKEVWRLQDTFYADVMKARAQDDELRPKLKKALD